MTAKGNVIAECMASPLLEWDGCLLWTLKSGLNSEKVYGHGVSNSVLKRF